MGRFVKIPEVTNTTAAQVIAKGTTAQRPSSPKSGMIRFNTTLGQLEFFNGTAFVGMSGGVNGKASVTVDTFTLDGSTTTYTMSTAPADEKNILAFIEGVFQKHDTYSISGTTLTVTAVASDNSKTLTVMHGFDTV